MEGSEAARQVRSGWPSQLTVSSALVCLEPGSRLTDTGLVLLTPANTISVNIQYNPLDHTTARDLLKGKPFFYQKNLNLLRLKVVVVVVRVSYLA